MAVVTLIFICLIYKLCTRWGQHLVIFITNFLGGGFQAFLSSMDIVWLRVTSRNLQDFPLFCVSPSLKTIPLGGVPLWHINLLKPNEIYTGCPRRNGQNFGRVFLMLNYTDITQNTYIQSWTVTEIMAIEKCGLLGCPRTVRRPWRHTHPVHMPGNETPLANIVMQWPWRDNTTAAGCVNYLET